MTTAALLDADFVFPPYLHQMREFELYSDSPARAWAWSMRTGKSKAAIDKACNAFRNFEIDGMLIFAPNGVHAAWAEVELPKHIWSGIVADSTIWRSTEIGKAHKGHDAWKKTFRATCKTAPFAVFCVNSESMIRPDARAAIRYFLNKRRPMLVVDESDDFGIPGSRRTKMIRALAKYCPIKIIMSGTMTTAGLFAAYSQFQILAPGALGFTRFDGFKEYFGEFELVRGKGGRKFNKLVGYKNEDELRRRMAPYMSVVLRDDCHDMPALNFDRRTFDLSPAQLRVYRDLHKAISVEIEGNRVSIGELASKLQKLQQISSGFLIDEYKKVHKIPGRNPRLELLLREVARESGRVIVWCEFKEEIDSVVIALRLEGYDVAEYHGRATARTKATALQSFAKQDGAKCLVGQCQAGGRGRDFSTASAIIWYSHTFKARFREQALERATKIGGRNIKVLDLVGPGPDSYILDTTAGRVQMANKLTGQGMKELLRSLKL